MGSASVLVAASLGRSFLRHRSRVIGAVLAGALGVALTTAILVLTGAVTSAVRGAAIDVPNAQWVASARSSSGMSELLTARADAVPGVDVAPLLRVSTRDARTGDPLLIVGVTDAIATFTGGAALPIGAGTTMTASEGGAPVDVLATAAWARSHRLEVGSELTFEAPGGARRAVIAGLLDRGLVRGSNAIVAPLPTVAAAFDRDGVTDAVLVRSDRVHDAALQREMKAAFDGAASVTRPEDSALSYERSFQSVRTILALFSFLSALVAATMVFFCWRVTLDDARPSVARLRLVGARRRALGTGAALVLLPVMALSAAIGAPIGVLLGSRLSGFTDDLVLLTQLAVEPGVPWRAPVLGGIVAALGVFAAALASSIRTLGRVPVIDAVVTGRLR